MLHSAAAFYRVSAAITLNYSVKGIQLLSLMILLLRVKSSHDLVRLAVLVCACAERERRGIDTKPVGIIEGGFPTVVPSSTYFYVLPPNYESGRKIRRFIGCRFLALAHEITLHQTLKSLGSK